MGEVVVESHEGFSVLTVDRPAVHNAIGRSTMAELSAAIDEIAASQARVLVLRGAGSKVFVSGGDLKDLAEIRTMDAAREMAMRMRSILDRIATLPIPVVAGVNGHAFGGGCETAVACDFRVAADDIKIAFNQVDLALMPAWGGIERLQALVGRARALYLTTTGSRIDASVAYSWGLLEEVIPRSEFDQRLLEIAAQVASAPRATLIGIKQAAERAHSAAAPQLAEAATADFAHTWVAEEHWTAVERATADRVAAKHRR